jgi:hypothetical protein
VKRRNSGWLILVLAAAAASATTRPAAAYSVEDVEAILTTRPASFPPAARSYTLARQKRILLNPSGRIQSEEHILRVVGPADSSGSIAQRWTFRPEVEAIWLAEGHVHRATGETEKIPSSAARVGPCAAAGEQGYPGTADFTVALADLSPGDVIELRVAQQKIYYFGEEQCFGEHRFASEDSTVESELSIRIPTGTEFRPRPLGGVPSARIDMMDGLLEGRWLTGFLPPGTQTSRSLLSESTVAVPDSARDLGLWFGFNTSWEQIVVVRRNLWRRALSEVPAELSEEGSKILDAAAQGEDPIRAAVSWSEQRLAPLDLAAARLWFEPAPLSSVLRRGAALPRDRALVLVWLLRQIGLRADAACLASTSPLLVDPAIPQRLDTWLVRVTTAQGEERWIDLRLGAGRTTPLPPGQALVWTGDPGTPAVVPFPGLGS